jgi:predicted esterase YcpF (UPF0227 family)
MIQKAINIAVQAHEGQLRKGTNIPYIVHPLRVMERLLRAGYSEEVACAGVLHDVIEDGDVLLSDIEYIFGKRVAELVDAATEIETQGVRDASTWKHRKEHKLDSFEALTDSEALAVIVADKLDNLADMVRDQKAIGEKLWERFNASYDEIVWFYTTIRNIYAFKHNVNQSGNDLFLNEFLESTQFLFPHEEPLKIYYIHGFGSQFDYTSEKVTKLARLGSVAGKTWDYTKPHIVLKDKMGKEIRKGDYDLIVGSSLGGYWASQLGTAFGIPFVTINPAINPAETLKKYIGKGVTHFGKPFELKSEVVAGYERFCEKDGCGLILLDKDDEVIDSVQTYNRYHPDSVEREKMGIRTYDVKMFDGGNHRFTHMVESLPIIQRFHSNAEVVYGLTND